MKPDELRTKIYLDGGNPKQTNEAQVLLGFLDGQTTNPSLVVNNPTAKDRLERGELFTEDELLSLYRDIVQGISHMMSDESVSVEVHSDLDTTADSMLSQAREMYSWANNVHVKFPITTEGLKAASQAVEEGMRVNMTLCFTQEQAAAVYCATKGADVGQVYISPFIGRLEDLGLRGMDLINNIVRMYDRGDGHVQVLAASVRNVDHVMASIRSGADIVTAPLEVYEEWVSGGMAVPGHDFSYEREDLARIPYRDIDITDSCDELLNEEGILSHEMTTKGVQRFADDWNGLLKK